MAPALVLALAPTLYASGGLSVYWPRDSTNTGVVLACDRPRRRRLYVPGSRHVALRGVWRLGCGRRVRVCARATRRCVDAPVLDAGPWGIIRGPRRNAVREGRWRVWVKRKAPPGWRFRAVVDVSRAVWVALGRPPALSRVDVYLLPRGR